MAQSRVKTWVDAEILTHTDLNAEINNILDNALNVISPLTGNLDAGNNTILNIGAAGTDFSATGGLTLADALTITAGGLTVTAGNLAVSSGTASVTEEDARTNTVAYNLTVGGTTSGSPAASIGTGIRVQAESADESPSTLADLDFILTDVGAGAEDSDFVLKLRQAGAAAAERFRVASDGTATLTGADAVTLSGVIDRDTSSQSVANTTTETTVYTYSVPANALGTDRMLRLTLLGQYLNNSGSNKTFTVRVKFGATTVYEGVAESLATGATERFHSLQFWLLARGATNAQYAYGHHLVGSLDTIGGANPDEGAGDRQTGHAAVAEDTTSAKTFSVTVQHGTAAATVTYQFDTAMLELI
jgi:hypothetical protein